MFTINCLFFKECNEELECESCYLDPETCSSCFSGFRLLTRRCEGKYRNWIYFLYLTYLRYCTTDALNITYLNIGNIYIHIHTCAYVFSACYDTECMACDAAACTNCTSGYLVVEGECVGEFGWNDLFYKHVYYQSMFVKNYFRGKWIQQ